MTVEEAVQRLQAGDAAGAVGILKQVTADEPENGAAFQYLGIALAQTGNSAGGLEALEHAVELLPDSPGVWFNLGVALNLSGSTDEAREALQQAVTLDPSHAKARAALDSLGGPASMSPESSVDIFAPTIAAPTVDVVSPLAPPGFPMVGAYRPQSPPTPVLGPRTSSPAGLVNPALGAGGVYVPTVPPTGNTYNAPPVGRRISRGLGWGIVCGQWWTLFMTLSMLLHGGGGRIGFTILGSFVLFGFVGAIVGLISASVNADVKTGTVIGVVVSLLMCGGEFLLEGGHFSSLINVFFWYFTGRFVGASVTARIQRPVTNQSPMRV